MNAITSNPVDQDLAQPASARRGPPRRRRVENTLLLGTLVGAVAFSVAAFSPTPEPPRIRADNVLRAIGGDEHLAIVAFRRIARDLEEGQPPKAAADRIEREVLPIWRRARIRAEEHVAGPLAPYLPAQLAECFRQRETAWLALCASLRTRDEIQSARYRRAWRRANRLADAIRTGQSAPGNLQRTAQK